MIVYRLTNEQKDILVNKEYTQGIKFNPILDNQDNWIISEYEVENCLEEFYWIKNLERIEFFPKYYEDI
jgi:hypothetical protein